MTKSVVKIHHPISVRSAIFSPSAWQPLQAVVGLDNGNIYRYSTIPQFRPYGLYSHRSKMGSQNVAKRPTRSSARRPLRTRHGPRLVQHASAAHPFLQRHVRQHPNQQRSRLARQRWSGSIGQGQSRTHRSVALTITTLCVPKIWNLTSPSANAHIPHKPTYSLHPSFPVRRVLWRPSYECELAVVSNEAFGTGSNHDLAHTTSTPTVSHPRVGSTPTDVLDGPGTSATTGKEPAGNAVEIWDVRRRWIAKWSVTGSAVEGGVTGKSVGIQMAYSQAPNCRFLDLTFADSHTVWTQHFSGTFSQIDLRDCIKPIDTVPRVALSWEASGSLAFVSDRKLRWEIPYDDM